MNICRFKSIVLVSMALMGGLAGNLGRAQTDTSPLASTSPNIEQRFGELANSQLAKPLDQLFPVNVANRPPLRGRPEDIDFIDLVSKELSLTDEHVGQLARDGMLLRRVNGTYSFPAAYYSIYVRDLPLLVTTDSILHAVHRTFDAVLEETENRVVHQQLQRILDRSHAQLVKEIDAASGESNQTSLRDVDLYLTVARNLLAGRPNRRNGIIPSHTGQDKTVSELLESIQASGELSRLSLYGSDRKIDFTQFKPRGRYTGYRQSLYFRTMMWLGRADCGWQTSPHPATGLRELRNAVVLNLLLDKAECDSMMADIDQFLSQLIGHCNGLSSVKLKSFTQAANLHAIEDTLTESRLSVLSESLQNFASNTLSVRSEASLSGPPPVRFQLMGQRFAIDSFILSQLVFDAIEDQGEHPKRMLPSPLDVMASLGNPLAVDLLRPEILKWRYGRNLAAARQLVQELDKDFWEQSFYNGWLHALKLVNREFADYENVPTALRGDVWQRKQLQTQLASWAELRRDSVLYVAQSLSQFDCEFPDAYVEPYPEFYATLRGLMLRLSHQPFVADNTLRSRFAARLDQNQKNFFERMAGHLEMLESIARKELGRIPLNDTENDFLQRTISRQGGVAVGSGLTNTIEYNGWYTELIYGFGGKDQEKAQPIVADVHTNPTGQEVLQVATGNTEFCVLLNDCEPDVQRVFVGPTFSYYEFVQPLNKRLTDGDWRNGLSSGAVGDKRPQWIRPIMTTGVVPATLLEPVTVERSGEKLVATIPRVGYSGTPGKVSIDLTDEGMSELAEKAPRLRWLNAADTPLTDKGLQALASLTELRVINLDNTSLRGEGLASLIGSQQVRRLTLRNTEIQDDVTGTIAGWKYLERLDLRDTQITDSTLAALGGLRYLRQLDLRGTHVSQAAIDALRQQLPKLTIIFDGE